MPRIPVYEQRTTPSGLGPQVQVSAPRIQADNGLAQVAQVTGAIADDLIKQRNQQVEDEEISRAQAYLSEQRLFYTQEMNRLEREWQPGQPGVFDTFSKQFKEGTKGALDTFKTPRVKQFLQGRLGDLETSFSTAAIGVDDKNRKVQSSYQMEQARQNGGNTLLLNPSLYDQVAAEYRASVQATNGLDFADRMKEEKAGLAHFAVSAEEGHRAKMGEKAYLDSRFRLVTGEAKPAPEQPAGLQLPTDQNLPAGLRNNNPGNIKFANQSDAIGPSKNRDQGDPQAVYATPEDGANAMFRLILKKYNGGKTSAAELIAGNMGWTPGNQDAAKNIARSYGVDPSADLNLKDAASLAKFGRALMIQEHGAANKTYSDELLLAAAQAALDGKKPAPRSGQSTVAAPVMEFGGQKYEFREDVPLSFRQLDVGDKVRLFNKAMQGLEQQRAVQAQTFVQRVQDSTAAAKDGIADPQPLTREQFAILGPKGEEAFKQYEANQTMARQIGGFTNASNQDLAAVVSGVNREAKPGAGYADADARDNIRMQAAAQVLKQREQDPAAYVYKNVPSVRDAFNAMSTQGLDAKGQAAATQKAVVESMAAQTRLGIQNPKILTKAQLDSYGDRILMAQRPEDVSDFVAGLEANYGPQFRAVMGELMKAEKLTPALMIIPDLPSAGARELVARVSMLKADQLKAGVDPDDAKDIKKALIEPMTALAKTIPATNLNNGKLLDAYQETAEKIALQMVQNGAKPSDAVERATKLLWGHYKIEDTLRLPTNVTFNVQKAARKALEADAQNLDVPPDITRARNPEIAKMEWATTVQRDPLFYADPSGSGVQLWARGMDGVLYRVTKGGKPVMYSFDELGRTPDPFAPHNRAGLAQRRFREKLNEETQRIRQQVEGQNP